MITPMKKYSFLVYHNDYQGFLDKLRELGVVHIAEKKSEEKQVQLQDQFERIRRYDETIRFLNRRDVEKDDESKTPGDRSPGEILEELDTLQKEEEENEQKESTLRKELVKLRPWGDYRKDDIEKLKQEGYELHLFSCPAKRFEDEWRDQYDIEIINHFKGQIYFVVIAPAGQEIEIDAEPEPVAERSLSELKKELKGLEQRNREISEAYDDHARRSIPILTRGKKELVDEIEYRSTLIDTEDQAEGTLKLLEGWVPEPREKKLLEFLDQSEAYYISTEPDKDEYPPILLENDKFTHLFEPIGRLFDLPNYKELDLTPFFAPFFMLFFGFCLGDAGYGLIFVVAAALLKRKVDRKMKPILTLAQFLGLGTVIFGALSGTFFGINLIDTGYTITGQTLAFLGGENLPSTVMDQLQQLQGVHFEARNDFLEAVRKTIGEKPLSNYRFEILKYTEPDIEWLDSFRHLMQNPLHMFYLSMIIGGAQIIFGKILLVFNIIKRKGLKYGFSTMGWVLLIVSLVFFMGGDNYGMLDLEKNRPVFNIFLIVSGGLIVFFNNPDSNVFMRPLNAIWDAYSVVTGVFQDILSYIRLFALGISSAILGFVFNDISSQLLGVPYIGWLLFLILLLFGHSINIFLATLGAFIHPMRLIFVEFYKNAGFRGGGKEYKPFSK